MRAPRDRSRATSSVTPACGVLCAGVGRRRARHQTSRTRRFSQYIVPRPRSWPILRYGRLSRCWPMSVAAVGVGGDLIDGGDDRVHLLRVVDVAALRAVAHEHAHRVDDDERRAHERREIGDRHVDVLVQAVAPAAERRRTSSSSPRCTCARLWCLATGTLMTLSASTSVREDRPLVEHLALQAHRAEAVLGGEDRPRRRAS